MKTLRILAILLLPLAGCQNALDSVANKAEHPLPEKLVNKMKANDMATRSPIMIRLFKEEAALEVWKQKGNGRFEKIVEYEICKWSGKLGPKIKEGDRQAPEGYYRVYPYQMNPNSSYYLSFNLGFPNSYDRAHGRTGTHLMVHGACSSAGCYSMTDEQVLEIYAFAREAFKGGQQYFLVAAYPFRMTPENMARHRNDPNFEFWKMLRIGYDQFELTKRPPQVEVCEKRYVFNQQPLSPGSRFEASGACPEMQTPAPLEMAYAAYQTKWNEAFAKAVSKADREEAKRLEAAAGKAEAEANKVAAEAERQNRLAAAAGGSPAPLTNLFSTSGQSMIRAFQPAAPAPAAVGQPSGTQATVETPATVGMPVPAADPQPAPEAAQAVPSEAAPADAGDKPFWRLWGSK